MMDSLTDRLFGRRRERRHGGSTCLFYRVELTPREGADRHEYEERAETLRQAINDALVNTGRFTSLWVTRTRDPYIALDDHVDGSNLSPGEERICDGTDERPWPEDVGFDPNGLLGPDDDAEAAQDDAKDVVIFEIYAAGSADTSESGFGAPAPIENVRELIAPFADHEDVAELERLYPFEDDHTYGFVTGGYEMRLKAVIDHGWPHVEWWVGSADERGAGLGWVGVVDDEEYGVTNGRLYLDDRRNDHAEKYIDAEIDSIPIPEPIAEAVIEDARRLQDEAAIERETPDRSAASERDTTGSASSSV